MKQREDFYSDIVALMTLMRFHTHTKSSRLAPVHQPLTIACFAFIEDESLMKRNIIVSNEVDASTEFY